MNTVETSKDPQYLAARVAEDTIATLSKAIQERGMASWVLAGGTSPTAAYMVLASDYADALDWSKVTVLLGDERCVSHDHPDSNWGNISKILFANASIRRANKLVPHAELGAEKGARLYDALLRSSLADEQGELHIDLIWLGIGEDGHTLSLFPGHPEIDIKDGFVLPVHDSPKPPAERITLSFRAAVTARKLVIFAVGASKKNALDTARRDPEALPIGRIAAAAQRLGHDIVWLS